MTSPADDRAAALAGQLRAAIDGLDGYIERRAAALAAPQIASAQAQAAAETAGLRAELERREDLAAELRRRIEGLENRLDDLRAAHGERRDPGVAARRLPVPLPPVGRPHGSATTGTPAVEAAGDGTGAVALAFAQAMQHISGLGDADESWRAATRLGELARQAMEGTGRLRAAVALRICQEEGLSLGQLGRRLGISKARAADLASQARKHAQG